MIRRSLWHGAASMAALASGMVGANAQAETLREALVRTYDSNPTLMAQREALRGLDEGVAAARSGTRPTLSATAGFNQDVLTTNAGDGRNITVGATATYPLYTGGRVPNQIRAANARVDAGRAALRAAEGDIFTSAVAAYMDVIRDRSIVSLNENQVRVLVTNLQATRDRFEIGDLTRTDVAQSEARLAISRSNLSIAQGQLRASEEGYRRIIGVNPGELDPPPMLPRLPEDPDGAEDVALDNNANLRSIADQVRAAGFDVRIRQADRLPTVSAAATGSYVNRLGTSEALGFGVPNDTTAIAVGFSARVPIYQGGLVSAQVRQAQAFQSQLTEQAIETERGVVAQVRAAFASYRASLEAIQSNEIAVAANQLALEGTRAEREVGTRNVLDVLNAEQELLNSQVLLITARRDAYVAGFALMNAMGQAEAEDLGLDGGTLYDPVVHYRAVQHRWSDWSDDPRYRPASTRTVAEDAHSPVTPIVYGPPRPATRPSPVATPGSLQAQEIAADAPPAPPPGPANPVEPAPSAPMSTPSPTPAMTAPAPTPATPPVTGSPQ